MPMMFRCPGELRHVTRGFLYDQRDMPDADKARADGWFDTLEEAAGLAPPVNAAAPANPEGVTSECAPDTKSQDAAAPIADDAPPTRAEMEAQAKKLGIKVDGRWSDSRLSAEIDKAME